MKILFPFAKRFIAGIGTQDSSLVFQKHLDQDYVVVANLVGENILSRDLISEIYDQYKILLPLDVALLIFNDKAIYPIE